ncbi:Cell division protein FtsW (plasmid) [Sinorhizobium sojae CCBAU 05684]|uniref:Cell division protein FtsW n=1 Tax=Sinorhizobium sojae CCBAU 05684 TaxID=716928 RepID=A0A249PLA1_9HYPH|nr:DUF2934 domain-containing protein [Sinorhizobium sojae]ASY66089.1 Cell division protein FtsW [Sinorhizobium sojae CCBAU 05684]
MDDREELIRRRAYAIWENEGRPDGQDKRHWEQASREMARGNGPDPMEETEGTTGALNAPAAPASLGGEKTPDANKA